MPYNISDILSACAAIIAVIVSIISLRAVNRLEKNIVRREDKRRAYSNLFDTVSRILFECPDNPDRVKLLYMPCIAELQLHSNNDVCKASMSFQESLLDYVRFVGERKKSGSSDKESDSEKARMQDFMTEYVKLIVLMKADLKI